MKLGVDARVTMRHLAELGTGSRQIARLLGVSESTVRYHLARQAAGARDGRADQPQRAAGMAEAITQYVESTGAGPVNYVPPAEFEQAYYGLQNSAVMSAVLNYQSLRRNRGGSSIHKLPQRESNRTRRSYNEAMPWGVPNEEMADRGPDGRQGPETSVTASNLGRTCTRVHARSRCATSGCRARPGGSAAPEFPRHGVDMLASARTRDRCGLA